MTDILANVQVKTILEFVKTLILKDADLSDEGFKFDITNSEKQEKYSKYIAFVNAFTRNDSAESYTTIELQYANSIVTSSELDTDTFLEWLRYQRYREFYGYEFKKTDEGMFILQEVISGERIMDLNSYYASIFNDKYVKSFNLLNFDSFCKRKITDDFFVSSFLKEDADIIYYNPDILSAKEVPTFIDTFNSSLAYFNILYRQNFYKNEPYFKPFGRTVLLFMAMQNYISKTLVNIMDIDLLSNFEAKNLLVSNQLDDFLSLPITYKRKLLKNLNYLIANKGTNKIFETIISIFDLDDVKIFKYLLTKDYYKTINGNILFNVPHLSFAKYDINEYDIIGKLNTVERLEIDKVVKDDFLWDTDSINNFIHKTDKNVINTKYISIESTTSIFRKSMELSYYINSIYEVDRYIKLNNKENTCFSIVLYEVSETKRLRLSDIISAMEYLVVRQHNLEDILPSEPTSIVNIYGFNNLTFKNNILLYDSIYNDLNTGEVTKVTKKVHLNKWTLEYIKENIDVDNLDITVGFGNNDYISTFNTSYKKNVKMLEIINNLINGGVINGEYHQPTFDHNTFMELSELKKALTVSIRRYDYFSKPDGSRYTSYMETDGYFYNECRELYNYLNINKYGASLTEIEVNDIIVNKLFYLLNSLNNFVDINDLSVLSNVSILVASDIKENIYKLVKIFKSYTIELSDLNIFYVYNDKHLNTVLFREHFFTGNFMDNTELTALNDMKQLNNSNSMTHLDEIQQTSKDNTKTTNNIDNEDNLILTDSITMERILYE